MIVPVVIAPPLVVVAVMRLTAMALVAVKPARAVVIVVVV
jgi:hypothetical protein